MLKPFAKLLESNVFRKKLGYLQDERGLPQMVSLANRDSCFYREGRVKPQALMTKMSAICPDDTRVLMDSGNSFYGAFIIGTVNVR